MRKWTKVNANRLWGLICALDGFRGNAMGTLEVSERFTDQLEASLNMVHAIQAELRAMATREEYQNIAADCSAVADALERGLKTATANAWE